MRTKSFSKIYPGVKKSDIWEAWVQVENWPKWDEGLEYCQLSKEFSFQEAKHFILKPKGGPKIKIILSEVIAETAFTDYCKFLGATMYDFHKLEEVEEGLRITNTITVKGPLSIIWSKLVAEKVAMSVPAQTEALVNYVRRIENPSL